MLLVGIALDRLLTGTVADRRAIFSFWSWFRRLAVEFDQLYSYIFFSRSLLHPARLTGIIFTISRLSPQAQKLPRSNHVAAIDADHQSPICPAQPHITITC